MKRRSDAVKEESKKAKVKRQKLGEANFNRIGFILPFAFYLLPFYFLRRVLFLTLSV